MTIETFTTIVADLSADYPQVATGASTHYNAPETTPWIMTIPNVGQPESDMIELGFYRQWVRLIPPRSFVWGVVRTNPDGTPYTGEGE